MVFEQSIDVAVKLKFQRILFSLIVLIWASVMLYFFTTGRIGKYLAPDFRPLALYGGLGLAVMGLFVLLTAGESASCGHDHSEGDPHDHEASEMHPLTSMCFMLAPLLFAVASTKDGFSVQALSRKALFDAPLTNSVFLAQDLPPLTLEEIEKTHRKNESGCYEFNLMELYFAVGDPELQKLIDGMKVETEGRLVMEKENNESGKRRRLYRLFITCCAADARAVPIILDFGDTSIPTLEENAWVKVSGVVTFPVERGAAQVVLQTATCEPKEAPWEESFMRNN
jgi:uncharacterized repeat protein (TIGR03943 family)